MAQVPCRETRLFGGAAGHMAGRPTLEPRSKRSRTYLVPKDLTTRDAGVAPPIAAAMKAKSDEAEARARAVAAAEAEREAAAAAAAAEAERKEKGDEDDEEDDDDDDDDDAPARRRLERKGRGVAHDAAAQKWRDLEGRAAKLVRRADACARAAGQPELEKPKRRKKYVEASSDDDDDDDDDAPRPRGRSAPKPKDDDPRPTLDECEALLREAELLPPPTELGQLGGAGAPHVRGLQGALGDVWKLVARCRLLAARARDAVARGSHGATSNAYDVRGQGYSVYARRAGSLPLIESTRTVRGDANRGDAVPGDESRRRRDLPRG